MATKRMICLTNADNSHRQPWSTDPVRQQLCDAILSTKQMSNKWSDKQTVYTDVN